MSEPNMFAETIGHADEGDAVAGEDRAEGHQPTLRLSPGAFAVFGTAKELHQGRHVGQVDHQTIDRQHAKEAFPEHAAREALRVSVIQSAPERFPEAPGEPGPRLAESLFGNAFI